MKLKYGINNCFKVIITPTMCYKCYKMTSYTASDVNDERF